MSNLVIIDDRGEITDRAALRAALLDDLPDVVTSLTATIRDQIPAYAALSTEQLAEVSAIASWGIRRVLDLWVEEADLSAADVQRFRGIGAARALDGRPLPGVLRAYRLAGRALTEMITARAGDRWAVGDAMALAKLWMATIDTLSEALHEGHAEAADRVGGDRRRAFADLLGDLLTGRQATVTALADRSRQLGVVLPSRPAVLVLETHVDRGRRALPDDALTDVLDDVLSDAGVAHDDAVLRCVREGRAVVVGGPAEVTTVCAAVAAAAVTRDVRGCRVDAARAGDLHRAYRLAVLALDRAPAHAHAGRPVLDEGDAQVLALLTANPLADAERAVAHVLGALSGPAHRHLLEGLDAFLIHGSASAAAAQLGLHPQSVRHRLRRLHELTGRDLRCAWDRFVLEAARRAG